MTYENLLLEYTDGIAVLTINREKVLNALNLKTLQELRAFFTKDALELPNLKGVILTGAGEKAFVAGADISEFSGFDQASGAAFAKSGQDVFFAIERFSKPVIAVIKGFALGGGCELAMACHLRIAGEKARFGQPEVNLGLIPGYGGTQRLIQYLGKTKATELLLTADMIGAEEAHRLGLVNYVMPPGEEMTKAAELLEKISQKAPVAISQIIESINAYFENCTNGFDFETKAFGNCCGTEDFKEGAAAFIEKRKANFIGK